MAMHPSTPAATTRPLLSIDSKPQTPNPKAPRPKPDAPTPKEQPLASEPLHDQAHTRPCECSPRAVDRSMDSDGPGLAEMAFALDMALDMDDDANRKGDGLSCVKNGGSPSHCRGMFLDDCSAAPSFGSPSDVTASSFVGLERMSQQERQALLALLSKAGPRG